MIVVSMLENAKKAKLVWSLSLLTVSIFYLLQYDSLITLLRFSGGTGFSETTLQAQEYHEIGTIVYSTAHSYFPQTSLVLHTLSEICGLSPTHGIFIIIAIFILFSIAIGIYLVKIITQTYTKKTFFMSAIIAFSFMSNTPLLSLNIGYRWIGLLMTSLLLCYVFKRGLGNRSDAAIALLLVSGITLGSPVALLLIVPFFLFFSLFERHRTKLVYASIPISYMIHSGYSYTLSLMNYTRFSWEGFVDFFDHIFRWEIPQRITPFGRTTLSIKEDLYITSAAYLSLLLLSFIVTLILTYDLAKERSARRKDAIAYVICGSMWLALMVVPVTYVGASIKPEASFSDIRTILMILVASLLPFIFMSRKLVARINAHKFFLVFTICLLVLSSFRTIYEAYPKSVHDPINVVEDPRLDPMSIDYVGRFLKSFVIGKTITFDYKTGLRTALYLASEGYETSVFISTLTPSEVIVIDTHGLEFDSIYSSSEIYVEAYNLSLTRNVIYNSGGVIVSQK